MAKAIILLAVCLILVTIFNESSGAAQKANGAQKANSASAAKASSAKAQAAAADMSKQDSMDNDEMKWHGLGKQKVKSN